jgi:hypothetical protein
MPSPLMAGRVRWAMAALTTTGAIGAGVHVHAHAAASPQPTPSLVRLATLSRAGDIPDHFAGISLEWSLVERYMGPRARPAFANLLRNLGTGVLRVGGSSQDQLPFEPAAPNSNRVITNEDLAAVRAALDDATGWRVILGTAMAPRTSARPRTSPDRARRFAQSVAQAFSGASADVAGIELGNEPDVSYAGNAQRYLRDFAAFSGATAPFAIVAPNTSEVIAPWAHPGTSERSWDWPKLLGAMAPAMSARAGTFATGHFYPVARRCAGDAYRCATIPRLLSEERMANLRHAVSEHVRAAARHGLPYRVEEVNSAANRGVHGVSDVAASAIWALDAMFNAAGSGAIGVNFHDAEVRAFSVPQEGNAYYNPIAYDPTAAMGAPTAAPEYYALLLFARLAQGAHGLRRADVGSGDVSAWQLESAAERRLFLINKADHAVAPRLAAPGGSCVIDRMSPVGGGLDARHVVIDGRAVAADGTWPGFQPTACDTRSGRLHVRLGPGEAAVVRVA